MKKILIIAISVLALTTISVLANDRWLPLYGDSSLQMFLDKTSLGFDNQNRYVNFIIKQQVAPLSEETLKQARQYVPNWTPSYDFRESQTLDCNYKRFKTNSRLAYYPDGRVEAVDFNKAWHYIQPNSNGAVLLVLCEKWK